MSVYYAVSEHLSIADTEQHSIEQDIAISGLALLGAQILKNCGGVNNLRIIADGEEYTFSGKMMTQAYHEALNAAESAKTLEIISDYWYNLYGQSYEPIPFAMMDFLDEGLETGSGALDGLFYSAYINADCDDNAGMAVAYGEKNGVMYTGEIPYKTVDSIPDGDWYAPQTAVVFDPDNLAGNDIARIESICKQLMQFSDFDTLNVSDKSISFFLNNLRVKGDVQLKQFMQIYAQLIEATDGECCLMGELVDSSAPDTRMFRFDVSADGGYMLEIASVD